MTPPMVPLQYVWVTALYCALSVMSVRAATLLSTLAQDPAGSVRRDLEIAMDFRTGVDLTVLHQLDLFLWNADSVAHTYRATIRLDDAGSPGEIVDSFDTLPTVLAGSIGTSVFADSGIPLAPEKIYWLVLQQIEATSTSSTDFFITLSQAADTGSFFSLVSTTQLKVKSGAVFQDIAPGWPGPEGYDNFLFSLTGDAVPEPHGVAFFLAGLAGLGVRRPPRLRALNFKPGPRL